MQSYLFIGLLPETPHDEDHSHRWLQVGADGLDVDEELAALAGLDHRDPEDGDEHQEQHKHPGAGRGETPISTLSPGHLLLTFFFTASLRYNLHT